MFYSCCSATLSSRLTVDFQVGRDGDVGVFDGAGVFSVVFVDHARQRDGAVGQQSDARVRQQRRPLLALPTGGHCQTH